MKKRTDWNNIQRILATIGGALLTLTAIYLTFIIYQGVFPDESLLTMELNAPWLIIGYLVIHGLLGTYVFYNKHLMDIVYYTLLGQTIYSIYLIMLIHLGQWPHFSHRMTLILWLLSTVMITIYHFILLWLYHRTCGMKRVLVAGETTAVLEAVQNIQWTDRVHFQVTHVVLSNYYYTIRKLIDEIDVVYLAGQFDETEQLRIYHALMRDNKQLCVESNLENLMMVNPRIIAIGSESTMELSTFAIRDELALIKRMLDLIIAMMLLIVTAPILLITAIAIRIDSPGPILYREKRVTLHERVYLNYKFRSMTLDETERDRQIVTTSDKSRITRVGGVIRRLRIDELPQLFNVIKGDLSLVGPRAERPFIVTKYSEENSDYHLRHQVRAGLTGYAQVHCSATLNRIKQLNFDLMYIKNYSPTQDVHLLFQTIQPLWNKIRGQVPEPRNEKKITLEQLDDQIQVYP